MCPAWFRMATAAEVVERDLSSVQDLMMDHLLQNVRAPIGDPFAIACQHRNRLPPMRPALRPPCHVPLHRPHPTLCDPIPGWMRDILTALAAIRPTMPPSLPPARPVGDNGDGGDRARDARLLYSRAPTDPRGWDRSVQRAIPAHGDSTDPRPAQPRRRSPARPFPSSAQPTLAQR